MIYRLTRTAAAMSILLCLFLRVFSKRGSLGNSTGRKNFGNASFHFGGGPSYALYRLNPNGTFDTAFSPRSSPSAGFSFNQIPRRISVLRTERFSSPSTFPAPATLALFFALQPERHARFDV
jgi:hypothetical protein